MIKSIMLKNLIYFGSPEFSAEILEFLLASKLVNVVGVVTPPDKPMGRKQILTPLPVAGLAEEYDLPTYKPYKLDDHNLSHIKLLKPDIFLVVSYGKIIPQSWLAIPKIGTFNIHFSLLPKYRGALCISEAIKNGDEETGVTLMEMDDKLDHGPIIKQLTASIDINDNVADLTTKLTQVAKEVLAQKLPEICAENYSKAPQDEAIATFTPSHKTITREAAFIPWSELSPLVIARNPDFRSDDAAIYKNQPKKLHSLIRSLNPEPGAWTTIPVQGEDLSVKILETSLENNKLTIQTVQLAGKQPVSWKQFLSGHKI